MDADGTGHDANKAVYHVDMTASVTTKEKATATYWLWDAGESGYQPVESYDVKIGDTTSLRRTILLLRQQTVWSMYSADGTQTLTAARQPNSRIG